MCVCVLGGGGYVCEDVCVCVGVLGGGGGTCVSEGVGGVGGVGGGGGGGARVGGCVCVCVY